MSNQNQNENGLGFVHRHPRYQDTLSTTIEGCETLYELYMRAVEKYSHRPLAGTRKQLPNGKFGSYSFISYREFNDKVKDFASGLRELKMVKNDRLGFYSVNREEALVTEVSGWTQSFTTVFLYDTLGPDSLEYIINHAEISVLVASIDKISKILAVANKCATLKYIVALPGEKKEIANNTKVKIINYNEVMEMGRKAHHHPEKPTPNDITTILYTSGTTGVPKGVVVEHRNLISAVAGVALTLPLVTDDVYFSYLPMAHIYEKLCQASGLLSGASVGFYQGDTTKLVEDVEELKPTIFAGVPRVYQRIYDRVMQQVSESPWHRRKLFEYAYSVKSEALKKREPTPYLDSLVFSKLKAKLGGKVRVMVSGSAPLSPALHEFLEICFCAPVIQGYGMSETMGAATISDTSLWWNARGHVGYPTPCTEIRLESVPEMNYKVTDYPLPRGEICLRGLNIFGGYYKMPEQTKETFTEDGFLRTGDIGQWNLDGTLQIIDRKKNIFKLSQGEYVAAEKVENVYVRSKYVAQIWIYGDSFRNHLVAIVVPDREVVIPWAKKALGLSDFTQICKHPEVNKLIMSDLVQYENEAKLSGFEKVKRIFLSPEEFTPDNELVTPTMKLKRPQLLKKFKQVIDDMYKDDAQISPVKTPSKL